MCKVFKIRTNTGLFTETNDPEIVRRLLDDYFGELTISISNKKEEGKEKVEHKKLFRFTLLTYDGYDKLGYIKELKKILDICLEQAKYIADNGSTVHRENLDDANRFEDILQKYGVRYAKSIFESDEN